MPKYPIFLPAIFILLSILPLSTSEESPDMIVILTRHGARESLRSEFAPRWPHPGYILEAGVRQHYTMGTVLGRRYAKLLENIDINQIYLQSTDRSRAQMSVSAELLGIFRNRTTNLKKKDFWVPYKDQELVHEVIEEILASPEDIPNILQIMSQNVVPITQEDLVTFNPWNCKLLDDQQAARLGDKFSEDMLNKLNDTIEILRNNGHKIVGGKEMRNLGGDVQVRYVLNESAQIPGVPLNSRVYNDSIFYFNWYNMYNYVGNETERAIRIFPLYTKLIEWFSGKLSGKNDLKFVLLGGHETSLFPFLELHNIAHYKCLEVNYFAFRDGKPKPFPDCIPPDFSSQLIYEFYRNHGKPFIRLLYDGKPYKLCPGTKGMDCPLHQFIKEFPVLTSHMDAVKHRILCKPELMEQGPPIEVVKLVEVIKEIEMVRYETPKMFYVLPVLTLVIGFLIRWVFEKMVSSLGKQKKQVEMDEMKERKRSLVKLDDSICDQTQDDIVLEEEEETWKIVKK